MTLATSKGLLRASSTILLDATHDTIKQGYQLFTLPTPDPATGKGVPLAYLICSHENQCLLSYWMYRLKDQLPGWQGPRAFVVDCDRSQIKAIREQFPSSQLFLCWFHVTRAWAANDKKVTKGGDKLSANAKDERVRELWVDLKELLHSKSANDAVEAVTKFEKKYENLSKPFWEYFSKQWLSKDDGVHPEMWQEDNLNTTNMLESWHRVLKYETFNGKPNRRLDVLLHHLYVKGDVSILHERFRAQTGAGRMIPAQSLKRRRAIEKKYEGTSTDDEELGERELRIQRAWPIARSNGFKELGGVKGNGTVSYSVASATAKGTSYTVTWDSSRNALKLPKQLVCDCQDFQRRGDPCKHVYAVLFRFRLDVLKDPKCLLVMNQAHTQEAQKLSESREIRSVPEQEPGLTPDQISTRINGIVSDIRESLLNNIDALDSARLDNLQNIVSHGIRSSTATANPLDPRGLTEGKRAWCHSKSKYKKQRR